MLIGAVGCGKSTFCRAIEGLVPLEKKTQAIEVLGNAIDTPGEYLENPRLHRALAATAAQVDVVLLMQSCVGNGGHFPPGFAWMFGEKPVYGVISKTDIAYTKEDIEKAEATLRFAGASKIFPVSAQTGQGLNLLQEELLP
ncbi:MAG: EutP/PduV family microcompartment system protein [Oscillospiraceae bacterium]|nr:EutP/PduV family microcompartment system protein [Oscillospiraceae bacterium]